jgi:hypothetical protein
MAVPNVNQITSTLRMLTDRQLQQYAQMHKGNPYIFPMAIAESNVRKQVRTATQAAQGAQPQPKVADQALAQMAPQQLPEDVGIATLPTPNMTMAAEGGIMGYEGYDEGDSNFGQESVRMMAEGGMVERYNGTQGSFVGGSIEEKYKQESMEMGAGARVQYSPDVQAYARAQEQASREGYAERERQRMLRSPYAELPKVDTRPAAAPAAAAPAAKVTPTFSPADYSGMDRRIMSGSMPNIPSISPPPKPTPKGGRDAKPGPGAGPAAPTRADTNKPAAGLGDLATTYEDILKKQNFKDPAEARIGELEKKELASAEADKAALLRDQAKFDDAYKGREKRLTDREMGISKQKDTNVGLAFLQAAGAALSTPGGLARALGAAAQVGTTQFAAGLDKIRSAQERLDDARDKMEDLKLNRAEMSAKEIRNAEKNIRNVGVDAEKRAIDGIRMAGDVNRKTALEIYKTTAEVGMNRERMASSEKIAGMQERGANARAGALPGEARAAMLLGTGTTDAERLASGMAKYKELTGDKQGTQLLKLFLEENGRREKNMEKPLTLEQFRRTSAAFYAPPAPVDTNKPTRP